MFIKAKAVSPCNELENIYHVREEQLKKMQQSQPLVK